MQAVASRVSHTTTFCANLCADKLPFGVTTEKKEEKKTHRTSHTVSEQVYSSTWSTRGHELCSVETWGRGEANRGTFSRLEPIRPGRMQYRIVMESTSGPCHTQWTRQALESRGRKLGDPKNKKFQGAHTVGHPR